MSYCQFKLGNDHYGISIDEVQEYIEEFDCTPLPENDNFLFGTTNLRGSIVPIVETSELLGVKAECGKKLLVLKPREDFYDEQFALLISDRCPIIKDTGEIYDASTAQNQDELKMLIKSNDNMVSILSVEALLKKVYDES